MGKLTYKAVADGQQKQWTPAANVLG
jgi:hypothetical protein